MKKIITTLLLVAAFYMGASAQRTCGTMEYYQHKLQKDPTLADRMSEEELRIQQWTHENPVEVPQVKIEPRFPEIEGFNPSGNEATDRANYATAKENYLASHPKEEPKALTAAEIEKAKAERKNNRLITNK